MVARHVASAVGLDGASAVAGLAVHMGLAVALGIVLSAMVQSLAALSDRAIWSFMTGSLAAVWAINFFIVLPVVSPGFVHLLPYSITLASKLAFGSAGAAVLQRLRPVHVGTRR